MNDSGVEEQDDTAIIPAETLCELLRRAFRLSPEKFKQYEEIVASHMEKKSAQKVSIFHIKSGKKSIFHVMNLPN